jgi:hypothetical protein
MMNQIWLFWAEARQKIIQEVKISTWVSHSILACDTSLHLLYLVPLPITTLLSTITILVSNSTKSLSVSAMRPIRLSNITILVSNSIKSLWVSTRLSTMLPITTLLSTITIVVSNSTYCHFQSVPDLVPLPITIILSTIVIVVSNSTKSLSVTTRLNIGSILRASDRRSISNSTYCHFQSVPDLVLWYLLVIIDQSVLVRYWSILNIHPYIAVTHSMTWLPLPVCLVRGEMNSTDA